MRLRTRLQKLERSRTFTGCPACRHRRVIVIRTRTSLPEGSVVWDVDKPLPCTRCGQIPEQIIEVILPVVEQGDGPFLIVSVRLKRRHPSLSPDVGTRKGVTTLLNPSWIRRRVQLLNYLARDVGSGFRHLAHVLYLIETVCE